MATVLVVTVDFPPDVGGIQQYVYQFCLRASRCSVVVLAPAAAGSASFDASAPFPIVRAAWPKGRGRIAALRKLRALPRFRRRVEELIRLHSPDVVFCGTSTAALAAAPPALGSGVPTVLAAYGIDAVSGRLSSRKIHLMRQAHTVIAISRFTRALLVDAGVPEDAITIVPPGVDLERFHPTVDATPAVERFGLAGKHVLLTVGRLDPAEQYKGHDVVIRALPQIVAAVENLLYVIAGQGGDRARLERLAAAEGVREHVLFAGYVEDELLPSLYAASDCFTMISGGPEASGFEGFGIAYLEAAASGKPSIAVRYAGAEEAVVDWETGLLVPPGDVDAVVAAAVRVLSDDGLRRRLGAAGRARVEAELGWAHQTARLEDVMLAAAGGTGPEPRA